MLLRAVMKKKRTGQPQNQKSNLWLRITQGLKKTSVKGSAILAIESKPFNLHDYLTGILVFLISFFVYGHTLSPTVDLHDSGEMISAAYSLGVSHPPGYPLYCIIGKLWLTFLPLGNIAYRMNLFSALSASVAVMMVCFIIIKLSNAWCAGQKNEHGQNRSSSIQNLIANIPGIAGAFMLCFATTFWQQAVISEKYTFNAMFATLLIFLLIKWQQMVKERQRAKDKGQGNMIHNTRLLYLFAFVLGLSFTHHLQTIFLVPASGFFIFWSYWKVYHNLLQKEIILKMAVCFFLPLILYSYLPIRASTHPIVNWGCPDTLERFIDHVTVKEYKYYFSSTIESLAHRLFIEHPKFFLKQFPFYLIWLGGLGIILLWKTKRDVLIFLGLILVFDIINSIRYGIHNIEDYYIPGYIITSILIGCGCGWLGVIIQNKLEKKMLIPFVSCLFLSIPMISFSCHYYYGNHRSNYYSYDYGMNILSPLREDAILYIKGDTFAFPLLYLHFVENIRNDIILIDQYSLFHDYYANQIKQQNPDLRFEFSPQTRVKVLTPDAETIINTRFDNIAQQNQKPIYLPFDEKIAQAYCLVPEGISHRALSKDATWQEQISVMTKDLRFTYRYILEQNIYKEERVESNISNYATSYNNRGKFYQEHEMYNEAIREFKKALSADPKRLITYYNIGTAYKDQSRFKEAIESFEHLIKLDPQDAKGYYGLAMTYHSNNEIDKAINEYQNAVSRDPNRDFIFLNLGNAYIAKKDYQNAIYAFQKACEINPQSIAGYYNLGVAYSQTSNIPQAIAAYQKVLSIDPNYEPAKTSLAVIGK